MNSSKFLFILALVLFLAACGEPQKTEKTAETEPDLIPVRTVAVLAASGQEEVSVSGLLASQKEAVLSFKTQGIIQKVLVKEGDSVAQGELLAVLNLTEIKAQADQAKEGQAKAARDLARVKQLFQDSVATQEQLDNATTADQVARRSLDIALYNLGYSEIRAPQTGVVIRKLMNEGELASVGNPVFRFSGTGDWVLRCGVSDQTWARLHKGDRAKVQFDAFPGTAFLGTVDQLAQGADVQTGLYQVEIRVEPQGKNLATGLFGKGSITVPSTAKGLILPVDALVNGQADQAQIFLIKEGKASRQDVKVLRLEGDRVLVSADLKAGSRVIVEGAAYLREGSSVKVVD